MPILRVALGQMNPRVGDMTANSAAMVALARDASAKGADVIAFPEMALTGYPIEDLALRPEFLTSAQHSLEALAQQLAAEGMADTPVVVGYPHGPIHDRSGSDEHAIAFNSAAVLADGRILGVYHKHHLPNYSVFDEYRVFRSGSGVTLLRIQGCDVALAICEDIWHHHGPVEHIAAEHPGLVLVINGSPFERDKDDVRVPLVAQRAQQTGAHVAYVNMVGGQDDLVFDGDSFVTGPGGLVIARSPKFVEHLLVVDLELPDARRQAGTHGEHVTVIDLPHVEREHPPLPVVSPVENMTESNEACWEALVLGLRDYVEKNGFAGVLLGLSGGIDSAVCATIAVDALGADRVTGISLPSVYSSDHSLSDAVALADNLGITYRVEPIAAGVTAIEEQLSLTGVAAENLQARMRGVILMGISNTSGQLVLTTGNKSEIAVGYSTIYGDSVGGFAPIKDVPKMLVWELARWRNDRSRKAGIVAPIPEGSITKPPSAELRPGQVDQDSLPDYAILDDILDRYVTQRASRHEIVAAGFAAEEVDRIIQLVDRAEWKRRQGAIGPKISEMSFGRDRRLPITYRHDPS
ncbi:MAG: NAD+ synthase [Actinobacteria bacterium]|uniref:NAD(+) synthase (glutamine-hydrolyzing) n=1 Tax=freshwater metagenome TaxID=449393 RepID=A0A6J7GF77_9ZZZZ|nr:NAD+ synthase [Actinomycetota bacterium]